MAFAGGSCVRDRNLQLAGVRDERARRSALGECVAQRVWGVDLKREFLDPVERNLFSIASNPRFADRCLNWEEAVTTIARMFKTFHRVPEDVENPTPYFAAVLKHFLDGDPKYVGKLAEIWANAPDKYPYKIRWSYPIVWDQPAIGIMRFRCLLSTASEIDGLALNDWIPVDADSWANLARLMESKVPSHAS